MPLQRKRAEEQVETRCTTHQTLLVLRVTEEVHRLMVRLQGKGAGMGVAVAGTGTAGPLREAACVGR